MISSKELDQLRLELSVKSKNGIDFILAATVVWSVITFVWTLQGSSYNKAVLTFIVGGIMLPLALGFSKIFKTNWKNKENPLQPLGLWLNLAQLFYFPFLILTLIKMPDHFAMVYVIITGAHFFPYGWFYKIIWYVIFAGIIVSGSLLLGLTVSIAATFFIPLFMVACLLLLFLVLNWDYRQKEKAIY